MTEENKNEENAESAESVEKAQKDLDEFVEKVLSDDKHPIEKQRERQR